MHVFSTNGQGLTLHSYKTTSLCRPMGYYADCMRRLLLTRNPNSCGSCKVRFWMLLWMRVPILPLLGSILQLNLAMKIICNYSFRKAFYMALSPFPRRQPSFINVTIFM